MFHTVDDVRKDYEARNPAGHWFSADATRFFGTVYFPKVYMTPCDGSRVYFVTSERLGFDHDSELAYSVRVYDVPTAEISTIGEFCGDSTLERAQMRASFISGDLSR